MKIEQERLQLLCDQYDYVMCLLRVIGVAENDVEDLTEEVFLAAYRNLNTLRDETLMKAWVRKIATNHAMKYFGRIKKRNEISHLIEQEDGQVDIYDMIADEHTVEQALQKAEEQQMVRRLLKQLNEVERSIIYMRFWGEYKFTEIAKILHLNVNTVKSTYRRSLQRLHRECRELFGEEARYG